jgi:hypothetical protein
VNASDAANNNLTDAQLDALLGSADQELLHHIQANTDPTATLVELLATPVTPEDGPADPDSGDPASKPGRPVHSQRTGPQRRSWRAIIPATVAVAGVAVVAISFAAAHATHHPASAVPLPAPTSPASMAARGVTTGAPSLYLPFSPGQSKLSKPAVDQLSMLLTIRSTTFRIAAITIIGYTNDLNHPAHARKITEMRVQAIRSWLIDHQVPACALHPIYHGAPVPGNQANALLGRGIIIIIRYANPAHPAQSTPPTYSCQQAAHSPG